MVGNIPAPGGFSQSFARWLAVLGALFGATKQIQGSVKNQISQRNQQIRREELNLAETTQKNHKTMERNKLKHDIFKSYNRNEINEEQQDELLEMVNSPAPIYARPLPKLGHNDLPNFPLSGFGQAIWRKTNSLKNSGNSGNSGNKFGSITLSNKQNKSQHNAINENQIIESLDTSLFKPFEINLMTPLSGVLAALAAAVIIGSYGSTVLKFTFSFLN